MVGLSFRQVLHSCDGGTPFPSGSPTRVIESIWEDRSYTGELTLRLGLVPKGRDEHIPQTNINPIYYHCNIVQNLKHLGTLYGTPKLAKLTEQVGFYSLVIWRSINTPPGNKSTPMLVLLPYQCNLTAHYQSLSNGLQCTSTRYS